ncbi:MAG: ABC transporter ATP-binding protein, partial [Nitriliruptoraceae bacterium]|nr:ABC transporter ATP-binding protein [Nitriliruptoraceae bacterium]
MTVSAPDPLALAPDPVHPALRLEDLRKVYGGNPPVEAVAGIDLHVERGEMFGLLGPNGAGKSTTVGICTTRIRPTSGRARVFGLDVASDAPRVKRRIGVVTQANTLDRSLTLGENLTYHCRYFGWSGRDARARSAELLDRFRLADRADAFPDQISGGMAQRLQVARAIAHRPELLFLDEPTAGLDPQSRIALWELVGSLRADGMTVVLTTHYMEEADALCDRVAIVDHGQVLVCDSPERLKAAHGLGAVIDVTLREPASDPDGLRAAIAARAAGRGVGAPGPRGPAGRWGPPGAPRGVNLGAPAGAGARPPGRPPG